MPGLYFLKILPKAGMGPQSVFNLTIKLRTTNPKALSHAYHLTSMRNTEFCSKTDA